VSSPLALARPEIVALRPYEHAMWDSRFERLHANELPWRGANDASIAGLNRYPEPHPASLVAQLAALYGVPSDQALACRGSDEAIDLLVRGFCAAGRDRVVVCPPTFGMYAVAARIQGAEVVSVPLRRDAGFALDVPGIVAACDIATKLVFVCAPNNPTANLLAEDDILALLSTLQGRALVVLDEAYIEFAGTPSFATRLREWRHLVVLRTFSKAFALAGARLGALLADPEIVALLRKVIPPYAIAQPTIEAAERALSEPLRRLGAERIAAVICERERVAAALAELPIVARVWPSRTNFLLVEFRDASAALERTRTAGLLVRDVRAHPALASALRISIGTPEQNDRLLGSLA
jgi:histidinol-phosphate aminotransferase